MRTPLTNLPVATILTFAIAPMMAGLTTPASADYGAGGSPAVVRFAMDNDLIVGSDDLFSAGWMLEYHGPLSESWKERADGTVRSPFARWVGRHVPGLDDRGPAGRRVRRSGGISQVIQTPNWIENPAPQPEAVPWAGVLGVHTTWVALDDERLNAFQVFLGCLGPCAQSDEVQRFVHNDLGLGDPPRGWEHQLEDKALINLNYELRRKLVASPDDGTGFDLAAGGQLGVGNFFSFVQAQLELRFGWGMPLGFAQVPDQPGRGIAMVPTTQPETGRGFWVTIVPRMVYLDRVSTLEGGRTSSGGRHPGVRYDSMFFEAVGGLHGRIGAFSVHWTYHHYPDPFIHTPVDRESSLSWANLTLEYRF